MRMPYDVNTDFASLVPFELRPVPRVSEVGVDEFDRMVLSSQTPVIIEGTESTWPAMSSWQDHTRLTELVGADPTVFCRQVADPAEPYQEDYQSLSFGRLIDEVFVEGASRNYLTQGLVFPPEGFFLRIARSSYPAHLQSLAVDCRLPPFVNRADLLEGVLWLGSGGQVTPLHFDDSDNLNVVIRGRKRWLLFPPSEIRNLCIDGNEARGSVVSSFEQLTADGRWRGGDVDHAYICETLPGQTLYVPAGYLHQVYSSDEPSIALNFWFIDQFNAAQVARSLRLRTIRRGGINNRAKRVAYGAALFGAIVFLRLKFLLRPSSMPIPDLQLGPTGYTSVQGL
jgi:[protein]-arginine 3-hydroxylase / protease